MWTKWPASSRISQRPPGGRNWSTCSGSVPQPISSGWRAEDGEERHRQAGQLEHRPLRAPRPEAAEAHRRVDLPAPAVVVLAGPDRRQVEQPLRRQPRVHPGPPLGQLLERARLAVVRAPCAGGARASPRRRCAIIFVRLCSATSGTIDAYGTPSRLTNEAIRYGWASPSWIIIPPPLECPTTGTGRPGLTWSNTAMASRRSASHEYSDGPVAVAVAALVPAHDAPAAGGQQRREHVVRAGEVEAAVHAQQRRRVGVAPLVRRQPDAVGVDAVLAVGRVGTGEGDVGGVARPTTLPRSRPWSKRRRVATMPRCGPLVGSHARRCRPRRRWPRPAPVDDDAGAERHAAADPDDHDGRRPRSPRRRRSPGSTRSSRATRWARSPPRSACRSRRSWRRTASPTRTRSSPGRSSSCRSPPEIVVDVAAADHHDAGRPRRRDHEHRLPSRPSLRRLCEP